MAKRADKKPMSAKNLNTIRRNGKAYKKNPKPATKDKPFASEIRDWKFERKARRIGLPEQKRNELGHLIKRVDGHDILVCDHPKGFIHVDPSKV